MDIGSQTIPLWMNHSIEDEVNERDSIDINSITYPCNSYKMPPFENQMMLHMLLGLLRFLSNNLKGWVLFFWWTSVFLGMVVGVLGCTFLGTTSRFCNLGLNIKLVKWCEHDTAWSGFTWLHSWHNDEPNCFQVSGELGLCVGKMSSLNWTKKLLDFGSFDNLLMLGLPLWMQADRACHSVKLRRPDIVQVLLLDSFCSEKNVSWPVMTPWIHTVIIGF